MTIGIAIALVAAAVLAVTQPSVLGFAALFMPLESPGVGAAVVGTAKWLVPVAYFGYMLTTLIVFGRLWRMRMRSRESRRVHTLAWLAAGMSLWIGLSIIATGGSRIEIMNKGLEIGPGVIFALALYRDRMAKSLLVIAVALHLLVGCGMIALPDSPFAGFRRPDVAFAVLPDVWRLETTMHKDSAQFQSAVQFSLYGAVALILGAYMLLYRRSWSRLAGLILTALGSAATFFTIERGVILGLVTGLFVLAIPIRRKAFGRMAYTICLMLAIAFVWLIVEAAQPSPLAVLKEHFVAVMSDTYRIPVAIQSLGTVTSRPAFGVGGDTARIVELAGGAPHQSFYFYAVAYGVPAGVFALALTWYAIAPNFRRWKRSCVPGFAQEDYYLARALGIVVVSMALTNGMSGGALAWMCLGYACLPWAHLVPRRKRIRPRPRQLATRGDAASEGRLTAA